MPAEPRVSVVEGDGVVSYYSDYATARAAIIANSLQRPLIMIWADLTEQLVLLSGADIWIGPGVEIKSGSSQTTIIGPTTGELICNIYGGGIIKNDTNGNCIFINNEDAKLKIECDVIEGIGGFGSSISVSVQAANTFHLTCSKVSNRDWQAIRIGHISNSGIINDINLNITKLETGNIPTVPPLTYTGITAITTRGNGFLKIDEILCRNVGHCLSHREGSITARIKRMSSTTNISGGIATLHVPGPSQGTGTQTLVLYFDHIDAFAGSFASGHAAELKGGKVSLIGGKINSSDSYGVICGGVLQEGFIKCNETLSDSYYPLNLGYFDGEISIIANSIIGNYQPTSGFSPVVNLDSSPLLIPRCSIKNSLIRNLNNAANAKGIYFENTNTALTLNNVKIVAGTQDDNVIYLSNGSSLDIKNYGLYGNKGITDNRIHLKIGDSGNFLFVSSTDLT